MKDQNGNTLTPGDRVEVASDSVVESEPYDLNGRRGEVVSENPGGKAARIRLDGEPWDYSESLSALKKIDVNGAATS